jgi:hypothetical protein
MADHAERENVIRAAIIDDDVEIRSGLRRVVEHAEGFACTGVRML